MRTAALLLSLTLVLACDGGSFDPGVGSLAIKVVVIPDGLPPAASLRTAIAAPGAVAHQQIAYNTFVSVQGPTFVRLELVFVPDSGYRGFITDLVPGPYDVWVEGLADGEVDHYGETNMTVSAGSTTSATILFASFRPIIDTLSDSTSAFSTVVTFPGVPNADSFTVQVDTTPTFSDPRSFTAATSPIIIDYDIAGTVFVRARAENRNVPAGRFGPLDSMVVTVAPLGGTAVAPVALGFGANADTTITNVNVFPASASSWLSLDLCAADTVTVETFAARLTPPSPLNTILSFWNSADSVIAANDDEGTTDSRLVVVPAVTGTYRVELLGTLATVGHYELSVTVTEGPNNTGSACM